MLIKEETGYRIYGNTLYYLYNFSVSQKLSQDKKLIFQKAGVAILLYLFYITIYYYKFNTKKHYYRWKSLFSDKKLNSPGYFISKTEG